jgi:acylphosphatase
MSGAKSEARIYHVRGRVQGVGYRNFVQQAAASLELTGWTSNLDDGRVAVYAQGPEERLTEFEGLLWKGPRWSEVRGVESNIAAPEKLRGFIIRH